MGCASQGMGHEQFSGPLVLTRKYIKGAFIEGHKALGQVFIAAKRRGIHAPLSRALTTANTHVG